ncbi:RsmB/NOP family class I SAM-dependent RNA methyltransferase [Solimonas sp. K1W22B-7]|uniref:RsmB/NOP family class I SAM-dependent RNA methyltransferase n=1 Tax=Solimonas sp. K1W22B-7 TaxID=2303331 RepID=UPI000E335022|nr:RsmB/NOP family class I SAM-dependent RNA methyltransferase [Solimonas sp. K1W22B-7]AXQ30981.1 RsmB/NOP family class I SAM-dependent RNA methyltransferase [Solimonas sp. K1W22B-7]
MSQVVDSTVAPVPALRRAQLLLARQALEAILAAQRPADAILQELFRDNRQCGSRDRARIGDLVYGVLRDLRRLRAIAPQADAGALCALRLLDLGQAGAETLADWGIAAAPALAQQLAQFDPAHLSAAQRHNMPDDCYARLLAQYGEDEAAALAQALNGPAQVDLRVNRLKSYREGAQQRLAEEGVAAAPTPRSPLGLRLAGRTPLQNLASFREGWVEPQDEGSQLIALLLAAQPGETVVDYCAGAGGKTLALAAQMQDRGELLACDISQTRLERLSPRVQRAGLRCVKLLALPDEGEMARRAGRCDAVLIDAPCSATGTWRRNPELRLRDPDFAALQKLQLEILAAAAVLPRPGGRLVYATCSLMAAENEEVIGRFLSEHPEYERQDAGAILRAAGAAWDEPELRMLPQRHGTDGFYAVAMQRRAQ